MAIIQILIYGISLGLSYALFALGYTVIFGVAGVLNLAHAAMFTVGGILAYTLVTAYGLNLIVAMVLAAIGAGICGVILNLILFRPLRQRGIGGGSLPAFLGSVALGTLVIDIALRAFGPQARTFPTGTWPQGTVRLGGIDAALSSLLIAALSITLLFSLLYLTHRTQLGRAMRAISERERTASLMGINVDAVIAITFFIASFLGGVAGVVIGGVFGDISPYMATSVEVKGLIIMIVGGIGSIPGAIVVSLVLGVAELLASYYISTMWSPMIVYVLLFAILYFRPQGLMPARME